MTRIGAPHSFRETRTEGSGMRQRLTVAGIAASVVFCAAAGAQRAGGGSGTGGTISADIAAARESGAAVLLVSEDLDELLELSDRLVVMFEGRIVHETQTAKADIAVIGPAMAGHHG